MKYEAVFGDQSLFDGAGLFTGIDIVTRSVDDGLYITSRLSDETSTSIKKNPIVAMRRIITEPKRWTWEDQKAGRLPEVGCIVLFTHNNFKCEVIAIDDSITVDVELALRFSDGSILVCKINKIKPIETPEEKAQRLRSEWINKAYVDFHRLGCELEVLQKEQIKQIYDALLSGELTMPGKVDE